ncbi:MAG: DNA repair protein RecN, partial [Brachymonas sp.]|nr:DNA repair protein RecN [Brachymonas sp.]
MALQRIILRDFVLVQALDLELHEGFNVLTGETGAGKSILLEALQLVMGARAEAQVVREGCDKADISAIFDSTEAAVTLLDEFGVEAALDGELLLRRTIDAQGKSRGWINGTPATATQLRALGALLVDIHGQHAWQSLLQPASTRQLLDAYGRIETQPLANLWEQWAQAQQQLQQAQQAQASSQAESERLQWQLGEMARLQPAAGEWEAINEEHQRLAHAKDLLDAAESSLAHIEDEQRGVLHNLHQAHSSLQAQRHIAPEYGEWADLLDGVQIQIKEIARNLHGSLSKPELDPARLATLEQRLSDWMALARRFQQQPENLPAVWEDWKQQWQALELQQDLAALEKAQQQAAKAYQQEADKITQLRQQAAASLSEAVTAAMQELGMQGGHLQVTIQPAAQPAIHGQDQVELLVAGHAGTTARPVAKVASGGELSRIALAIAVTSSLLEQAPTLVFDEVDAGIGGSVAHTVGRLMRQLGAHRQVLAVTHLA